MEMINFVQYIASHRVMENERTYTFIDLFAGTGGFSEGFIRAGFTPVAHIEIYLEHHKKVTRMLIHDSESRILTTYNKKGQ